jgi:mono/diheme cytochrome c family protein
MGPALETIRRPQGTLQLAGRFWNHVPAMFAALEKQGLAWPELRREEMADLMAYFQAEPGRDPAPDLVRGQATLVHKGCLKCHRLRGEGGAMASELADDPARYESPIAWAAAIWKHSPRMAGRVAGVGLLYPRFAGDEMGNLVGFLRSVARPR